MQSLSLSLRDKDPEIEVKPDSDSDCKSAFLSQKFNSLSDSEAVSRRELQIAN